MSRGSPRAKRGPRRRAGRLALEALEPRQFLSGVSPLDSGPYLPASVVANNDSLATDEDQALLIRAGQLLGNDTGGGTSFLDAAWSRFGGGSTGHAPTDDLLFIHHSVGDNWLNSGLNDVLVAKSYVDERNDITYGTSMSPDAGRPASLGAIPGDLTDMNHWVLWFNDYLGRIKTHDCDSGVNKIVMFKSCFPASNVTSDGTAPGNPFSDTQTLTNYRAVYHHPSGSGNRYSYGGSTYAALEDVFAANPDTLFIPVTAPPRNYAPWDETDNAEAHRARLFNNWLKNDWLTSYNTAHPGLDNVAVFDFFDVLAYSDTDPSHPNRLQAEYGGDAGDSHPNDVANAQATSVFAAGSLLSITATTAPLHGTLDDNGDGTYTYTPPSGFHGTDTFTYTASDGSTSSTATVSVAVVEPLGTVDFQRESHLNLSTSDLWYRLSTARQGQLTLEAAFAGAPDSVRLALCDAGRNELATAAMVNGRLRIDSPVEAGTTYHVHLSGSNTDAGLYLVNLVRRSGTALTVYGTAGDDQLVFDASTDRRVTVNDVGYGFTAAQVASATFNGGDGNDTALLIGTAGDDQFDFNPGSAHWVCPGLTLDATHVESITAQGGGGVDVASLRDSPGDDAFTATPRYGELAGAGFRGRAEGFDYVHAYALRGGVDVASLYDSAGDDTFVATPDSARLRGARFNNRAKFFEYVHAYARAGGVDSAFLYDSAGDDTFVATPDSARLRGARFNNRAKFFEQVRAFATAGGRDRAFLTDSPRVDYLEADANWARLSNAEIPFAIWVCDFDRVTATATHPHNQAHVAPTVDFLFTVGVWDPV